MWDILATVNLSGVTELLTGDFLELIIVVLIVSMIIGLFSYLKLKK